MKSKTIGLVYSPRKGFAITDSELEIVGKEVFQNALFRLWGYTGRESDEFLDALGLAIDETIESIIAATGHIPFYPVPEFVEKRAWRVYERFGFDESIKVYASLFGAESGRMLAA